MKNMKVKTILLKSLLLIQIIICVLTPSEISSGLVLQFFLFIGISMLFWVGIAPAIKHRETMEQFSKANYEFTMRIFGQKIKNPEEAGKQRLRISIIAFWVFISIILLVFLIAFLSYVSSNILWIKYHFYKMTRIISLIIFIVGCYILIRDKIKNIRIFGKENITITGLIFENILFAMIAFIN